MASPRRPGRFLPADPRVEEPFRLTPQLALRIAILGTIVLGVFAVLFLRLWALQILSGAQYLNAAENNQLRTVRVGAPRGLILDRNGVALVGNVAGSSVQIWRADLPERGDPVNRYQMLKRLSRILNVPLPRMLRQIAKRKNDPLTPVTVKRGVHRDLVIYLSERQAEFPGVRVAQTSLRDYPFTALGAQVLGYVGEASQQQLEADDLLHLGDEIGQGGVEAAYDDFLRGTPGISQLRVDSLGRPRSNLVPKEVPRPGHSIRLTIDRRLQQAAERALRYGIETAHANEEWYANGGALVALDPRTGAVLAMASNPTYKPSVFVGRSDPQKLAPLLDQRAARAANYPALNRAVAGEYPPGSTFKPVTALAAMEEHLVSPYESLPCTSSYTSRYDRNVEKQIFRNWDPYVSTVMTLPTALAASCDTYFYALGDEFWILPPERGHPLQQWASRLGFGEATGVDLGPESDGLLPTPEWRRRTYESAIDRLWKPGDSIQLAIGQKDLLVTPLQMARFYALVANGGKIVTPHLVTDAEQPGQNGAPISVRQRFTPPAPQASGVDPEAIAVVREGLYLAAHAANGTSSGVFGSFPVPIAGKTGTAEKYSAEHGRMLDQAWWCGYGPADDPEIVVCALIENGGHGGTTAAPTALKVFEQYFQARGGPMTVVATD
ncbi:MAG: penicillin-binding protein 2 [Gaiellaceae bacterium]